MKHSRVCNGESDSSGGAPCDCDGILAAGTHPLPYVGVGMVLRLRLGDAGVGGYHHGVTWRVVDVYEDGADTIVDLRPGPGMSPALGELRLSSILVRERATLAADYDSSAEAAEERWRREQDGGRE